MIRATLRASAPVGTRSPRRVPALLRGSSVIHGAILATRLQTAALPVITVPLVSSLPKPRHRSSFPSLSDVWTYRLDLEACFPIQTHHVHTSPAPHRLAPGCGAARTAARDRRRSRC